MNFSFPGIELSVLHIGTLVIFAVAMGWLAFVTLLKAVRLRNVRMSWNAGKFGGYPIFSTFFFGFSVLLLIFTVVEASLNDFLIASLYVWMSGGWFTTSFFASRRYITDNGIVKNVNEPSQTVAWYQIKDFIIRPEEGASRYIFMYSGSEEDTVKIIRLELIVPNKKVEAFQKLISHKLGRRISCSTDMQIDTEQFQWKAN